MPSAGIRAPDFNAMVFTKTHYGATSIAIRVKTEIGYF
jgi:hypothetical protein